MSSVAKKVTKKVVKPSAHPPYGDMVKKAIQEMKERKGSSRQAIIKYIRANFKISATENVEGFVRRSLVAGSKAGRFVHTKGTGASGSFKLAEKAAPKTKKPKAKKVKKTKSPRKVKSAKKAAKPSASGAAKVKKKTPVKKVKSAAKKVKTPKRAGAKKTPVKKVARK